MPYTQATIFMPYTSLHAISIGNSVKTEIDGIKFQGKIAEIASTPTPRDGLYRVVVRLEASENDIFPIFERTTLLSIKTNKNTIFKKITINGLNNKK